MAVAPRYVELHAHLGRWLRWARLRAALVWAVRGVLAGLAAGLSLTILARLQPVWDVRQLVRYVGLGAPAAGLLAGVGAYLWPRTRMHAARSFDYVLALNERTSTALELAARPARAPAVFVQRQLDDAVRAARTVDVRRRLPLRFRRNEALLGVLLLALLIAGLSLPNDQLQVLAEQRALQAAIDEQVAALEEIRADIHDDATLTDAQREELLSPLQEALDQLQAGDLSREEAVSVLVASEQGLRALADPAALNQQAQGLQQVGTEFGESALTSETGQRLAAQDFNAAAQSLSNLNVSELSTGERQELAAQLEAAAEQLADSAPQIASDFERAAAALRAGDVSAAQQALQDAAAQLEQIAAEQTQAQAAAQAAGQVAQAQQALAGGEQATAAQPGGQLQSGQNAAPGQAGQSSALGASELQLGEGAGSSGSGQGEGVSATTGEQAGTQPIGQDAPSDGGARGYESIFAPERLGGQGGVEVQLEGSGEPGDEIVAQNPTTPEEAEAIVPYDEVFSTYSEAAYHAVESEQVPVGLRSVVRLYFQNLEPGK